MVRRTVTIMKICHLNLDSSSFRANLFLAGRFHDVQITVRVIRYVMVLRRHIHGGCMPHPNLPPPPPPPHTHTHVHAVHLPRTCLVPMPHAIRDRAEVLHCYNKFKKHLCSKIIVSTVTIIIYCNYSIVSSIS